MQTAIQQIAEIDLLIDANTRALMGRVHCDPGMSAHMWQNAWDRCPDLSATRDDLFRQRGESQLVRDREIHKEHLSQQRKERAAHRKAMRQELLQSRCGTSRASPGASQGFNGRQREPIGLGRIS